MWRVCLPSPGSQLHFDFDFDFVLTRALIGKMAKRVTFSDVTAETARDDSEHEESDHSSAEDSFCEITTSEGETFHSSDDKDAERWQMFLEQVYITSPHRLSRTVSPAQRTSLLLLDKDLVDSDELSEGECVRVCVYSHPLCSVCACVCVLIRCMQGGTIL